MVKQLQKQVQSFLARKGIAISRMDGPPPRPLKSYLGELTAGALIFDRICISDTDLETLHACFDHFPAEKLHFESASSPEEFKAKWASATTLLTACDIMPFVMTHGSPSLEWLGNSQAVIIRSRLLDLLSGEIDLYAVHEMMGKAGFELHDVLQNGTNNSVASAGANLFFAFERKNIRTHLNSGQPDRGFRIAEALTTLGMPIVVEKYHKELLGRGSYGYAAGVLNAAVLWDSDPLQILARGERVPWPVQKRNNSHSGFVRATQPLLITLGANMEILDCQEVNFKNQDQHSMSRFEDCRLFRVGNQLYSNHVIMHCPREGLDSTPVRPQELRTSMGLARFDPDKASLTHLGEICLDRPLSPTEKNWAVFGHRGRVNLIYSFNPYCLFAADIFPALAFSQIMERELVFPHPEDGLQFRNSINPVSYDDQHYLHIVHKAYPVKRYVFWAVLIDKESLLPVRISRRPLISNRASARNSIIYVLSAMVREDEVLIFGGIDDCGIGTWRVPRAVIDSEWSAIG